MVKPVVSQRGGGLLYARQLKKKKKKKGDTLLFLSLISLIDECKCVTYKMYYSCLVVQLPFHVYEEMDPNC